MGKNKKQIKSHTIQTRCTEDEYRHYKRQAEKEGIKNLSEYIRLVLFCKNENPKKYAIFLTEAQEILNYVIDTYGGDEILEGKVEYLWDILEE